MSPSRKRPVHRFAHEAMATVFEIFVADREEAYAGQAARAAFGEIDRIERLFSRFDPSSETSRIGRLKTGDTLPVGLETAEILGLSPRSSRRRRRALSTSTSGLPSPRPETARRLPRLP